LAVVHNGDKTSVWRVKDNAVHKIEIALGARDQRRGDFVVTSGLAEGDLILRSPSTTLKDGQKVDLSNKPLAPANKPAAAETKTDTKTDTKGK